MITYKVTPELNTPLWKKFLRWLRLMKPRTEFELCFESKWFSKGVIVDSGQGELRILDDGEVKLP